MAELVYERITEGEPQHWLYVLHGIFGAGRNWGTVARRVVRVRPDWGALLIDLRQHGGSQGFAPPHTVAAAATDLVELAGRAPAPSALLGHSFGGKVALVAAGLAPLRERLSQVWVIDSTPGAHTPDGTAWQMLQLIRSLPDTFTTRDELVSALVQAGVARPVAQWMATNLVHGAGGYRWRFEVDAIEGLLRSFYDTDAWDLVESPPAQLELHLVRASRGSVLSSAAVERARRAAVVHGRVMVHEVEGGHWLNADNPDSVVDLLVQNLKSTLRNS